MLFVNSRTDPVHDFIANSRELIETVTGPAHTVTNNWEPNRDVLDWKDNKVGTDSISKYDYSVNAIQQRENVTRAGTAMSTSNTIGWIYNARDELTKEDFDNDGTDDSRDRVFEFDSIGNRKKTASATLTLPGSPNYIADDVNQYTKVNGVTLPVPAYDIDGNYTHGPLPAYPATNADLVWDAENRLVKITKSNGDIIEYDYDYLSRRISTTFDPTSGPPVTTHFLYDGWNLIAEFTGTTLAKTYTWGMDLSGSMQGAGGVGGLLAVSEHTVVSGNPVRTPFYPTYDGNGNISEYLDGNSVKKAHYEYDAFGNTVSSSGDKVADFAHRFSTKPLDTETGFYYYLYRYYDPLTGRWPSRDPIEEEGGLNLYGFVENDAVNNVDLYGQTISDPVIGLVILASARITYKCSCDPKDFDGEGPTAMDKAACPNEIFSKSDNVSSKIFPVMTKQIKLTFEANLLKANLLGDLLKEADAHCKKEFSTCPLAKIVAPESDSSIVKSRQFTGPETPTSLSQP